MLFETHKSAELSVFSELWGGGLQVWGSVNLLLFKPWFVVVYEVLDGSEKILCSILISTTEQIESLKDQSDIVEVNLISPNKLNGQDGFWRMESVKEILVAEEPTDKRSKVNIYVVNGGARYVESMLSTLESELRNVRYIFQAKN